MRKNITCFIQSLGGGGMEHQMSILMTLLVEKGYDVTLSTFSDTADHYKLPSSVKRVRLAQKRSNLFKTLAVFKYFLSVKTDCVISFDQRCNFLCLIPLFLRKKIKVIVGERNVTYKPNRMEHVLFGCLYKRANSIVPNSYSQARYIVKKIPAYDAKVVPIINYTEIDIYKASELPLGKTLKLVVFARFEKQKNCIPFMEMLSKLKQISKREFHVDWYGIHQFKNPILAGYFDEVQEKLKELDIDDVFTIKPPTKNVQEVITQYDAACLPSLYEGFSNSISEGIASGHPMLVSDVSDNSVMVKDGLNGFLFNPHDINSMLDAFNKFFNLSDDEIRKMGTESRKIAETLFNKDVFIESYVKLIES